MHNWIFIFKKKKNDNLYTGIICACLLFTCLFCAHVWRWSSGYPASTCPGRLPASPGSISGTCQQWREEGAISCASWGVLFSAFMIYFSCFSLDRGCAGEMLSESSSSENLLGSQTCARHIINFDQLFKGCFFIEYM